MVLITEIKFVIMDIIVVILYLQHILEVCHLLVAIRGIRSFTSFDKNHVYAFYLYRHVHIEDSVNFATSFSFLLQDVNCSAGRYYKGDLRLP